MTQRSDPRGAIRSRLIDVGLAVPEGLFYAMKRLSPKAMFPGHARGREHVFVEFAREAAAEGLRIPVHCPEFGGDYFTVPAVPPREPAGK